MEVWIVAGTVVLDQATKALVRARLDLSEGITVIPGFFDLTRVHNTGAAFGLLNTADIPMKTVILGIVAVAALAGLTMYAATLPAEHRVTRVGLAFIIGGAVGNLTDRLTTGYVVDFVDLYWAGWHFWAFNVADAAITAGVALMILDILGIGRHRAPGTV